MPLGQSRSSEDESPAPSATRALLLRGRRIWCVKAGRLDVFSAPLSHGRVAGPRRHLFGVSAGEIVCGLDAGDEETDRALQAVGAFGTTVREIPASAVSTAQIEKWVTALYEALSPGVGPRELREVAPGERVAVSESTALQPGADVVWLRLTAGAATLWAHAACAVPPGAAAPVAVPGWLAIESGSTVESLTTADVIAPGTLLDELSGFHLAVLEAARLRDGELSQGERQWQERRARASRIGLTGALVGLAGVLRPTTPEEAPLRGGDAPMTRAEMLMATCRLVAKDLGLRLETGRTREGAPVREMLYAMARASRFRVRRVSLLDQWWRQDNGPLIAFRAEDRRPVALLPRGPGRYVLQDSQDTRRVVVTAAVARTLASHAYMFYRPFPPTALSAVDLLRFGVRRCRTDLAIVVAMGAVTTLLGMLTPIASGIVFDTIIPGAQRGQLVQVAFVLMACTIAATLFQVTRAVALVRLDSSMGVAVQAAVWDRLLSLPLPFFRRYAAGDLAVRAMSIDSIRQILSGAVVRGFLGGVFSAFNFALLFFYSAALAWHAALLVGSAFAVTLAVGYLSLRYQREIAVVRAKTSGLVLQLLNGVSKIRVAGAETRAFENWAALFSRQREALYRMRGTVASFTAFQAVLGVASSMVLFSALDLQAKDKALSVGEFVAFTTAFNTCLSATLSTGSALLSLLMVVPQFELAKPIIQTCPEISDATADPGQLTGDIKIDHVVFRYQPDGPPTLHDVTVHIRPGEFVAFVGPSGSGKSTILRLLLGFETPETGAVYYDGQDLRGIDIQAVRRQIGVVLQAGRLTPGDIYTQIVGASTATLDDAWEAARMAGLDADIRQMPMGMHTNITEGGSTLSGGQQQRLMIARALIGKPRIMLLDEATSALDNRTQAIVGASMEKLRATRIVVAHRLSTIVSADRICVVERGRIVQTGTYQELLAQEGLFAELAKRQLA
jgi:NHLM bacteriocin system ABC transporter ATP-binding protein